MNLRREGLSNGCWFLQAMAALPVVINQSSIYVMSKYKCPCKYTYDPEKGDPKQGIPAGTKFEDLPDTWRCPRCKRKKEKFVAVEE